MNANEIIAIANFLGNEINEEQATKLMDECRQLSIADCERILSSLDGGIFYTEMSMHDAEMRGLYRY